MRLAEAGELLARTFEVFRRNWRLVFVLTLPIVVVVDGVTALGVGAWLVVARDTTPLSAWLNAGGQVTPGTIGTSGVTSSSIIVSTSLLICASPIASCASSYPRSMPI